MEPIKPPKTLKIYALIKQSGAAFSYATGGSTNLTLGTGFFTTQQEAEYHRTIEVLKDTSTTGTAKPRFHVFELEVPNPIHEE